MRSLFHIGPKIRVAEIMDCGAVFRYLPSLVPTNLISKVEWEHVVKRADGLSTSILGFEFDLGKSIQQADLLLGIIPNSKAEEAYRNKDNSTPVDSFEAVFANHLDKIRNGSIPEASLISMTILEYDVASAGGKLNAPPAVFHGILTQTKGEPGIRDPQAAGRLAAILASSIGRPVDVQETNAVQKIIADLPSNVRLVWIGAMPGREPRMIRILLRGLESESLLENLHQMGWAGPTETVSRVLEVVDGCFEHLTVQLEISADGFLPRLGLEIYALNKPDSSSSFANWAAAPDSTPWQPALSRLEDSGLCLPSKASSLLAFPGREYLYEQGVFEVHKGINHIKISIEDNRACTAKAYVGLLFRAAKI
ncbi:MAG: hypothetical protein OXE41_12470 [Gammaproteobacteria bacterium]|nr:hypothetical protein [Gammaproteobacteria bacterium]MCY4219721.1 hypothetical protein [Gammaproteobacteria bacterium]MCY4276183.1 hypothetical protein [Gammaproteobacteria bacterium]